MTYTVSSGTLNSTIPYHTIQQSLFRNADSPWCVKFPFEFVLLTHNEIFGLRFIPPFVTCGGFQVFWWIVKITGFAQPHSFRTSLISYYWAVHAVNIFFNRWVLSTTSMGGAADFKVGVQKFYPHFSKCGGASNLDISTN